MKKRNGHIVSIIRHEAKGFTSAIPSSKLYSRKIKHKKKPSYR